MARLKIDTDVDLSEPFSKQQLVRAVSAMNGPYEVLLKPINPKRSNEQNRFYWRVVCQTLAEWFTERGQIMTKDEAHYILAVSFNAKTFTNPVTGEVIKAPASTSALDTPEFTAYLDECIREMARYDIQLPPRPGDERAEGRRRTRQPVPAMT